MREKKWGTVSLLQKKKKEVVLLERERDKGN